MKLNRYGILAKKYLEEYKPFKFSRLVMDGSIMDYLYDKEKYLYEFADIIKLHLKNIYPKPNTNEFIVIAHYNNMIDSMVEEYVRDEIIKIV